MVYSGNEPYVFISYSHSDKERVENLLRFMHSANIRFWYDSDIRPGEEWKSYIDGRLENSRRFLLFLTNGIEQRPEIIRELKMAMNKYEQDPGYKIIVVVMEYVPLNFLFRNEPELSGLFSKLQYIFVPKYGGITFSFLKAFLSYTLWPTGLRDKSNASRKEFAFQAGEDEEFDFLDDYKDIMKENKYIYPLARPKEYQSSRLHFFQVKPGETDKNAVYPMTMDNQWCPKSFFTDSRFMDQGFLSDELRDIRNEKQFIEICRSLLHNWQLIMNRASVFNTKTIIDLYSDTGEIGDAFCQLLENGSIVIFLYKENAPDEKPKYDCDEKAYLAWKKICEEHVLYCIKLDWESDDNNAIEADKRMSVQFRNMLMCVTDDKYRLNIICDAMNIAEEQRDAFRSRWQKVRQSIINKNINCPIAEIKSYNREEFYKEFLIKDGTKVNDCILDRNKPFAIELKQLVDLMYSFNLPFSISVRPVAGYDSELWDSLSAELDAAPDARLLSVEELCCALISFIPDFIQKKVWQPEQSSINLKDIHTIRTLPLWYEYMQAVDSGRKRASLNEIDFYDIQKVWTSYQKLMKRCRKLFPQLQWKETTGSVSVIFRFGEFRLTVIYCRSSNHIKIITRNTDHKFSKAQDTLRIDYICADISETDIASNPFYSVQCLFNGKVAEESRKAYERILSMIRQSGAVIDEVEMDET